MRLADNHAGWNIQYFDGEWKDMYSKPFKTREEVEIIFSRIHGSREYRIYPSLTTSMKNG